MHTVDHIRSLLAALDARVRYDIITIGIVRLREIHKMRRRGYRRGLGVTLRNRDDQDYPQHRLQLDGNTIRLRTTYEKGQLHVSTSLGTWAAFRDACSRERNELKKAKGMTQ